ncbi:ATP-binding protein [Streptomyces sp. NPDC059788]|uniref:ATP-binding protein n=1 Tax=Streptomyces sp. NPDC059788 TaxID=3346948 RepID=UPI0036608AF1
MGNLPDEGSRLVGRGPELAEAVRLCGRSRLVTVTGVGGVGKTRLVRRAAGRLQSSFADGVWWVELSPLTAAEQVLPYAIARALPLADRTSRPVVDVVAEYLAGREVLLVLDTCEHLIDACRDTVATLLTVAPKLRVLATSRRSFGLPAEETLALGPLPVPAADGDDAADVADAVVLLADRAAEAVPGFAVTDANRAEVSALCRRLEGLPLALELAAARLRQIPLSVLNRRLADRYAALGDTEDVDEDDVEGAVADGTVDADPPWHRALRTAIGWSHQLCTPAERLLWARLSVFAGSFDAEAAQAVCADERLPAGQVPRLLAALAEDSIVEWMPTGAGERYRMLDTIHEYGTFWLDGLGEGRTLRRRHRDHYLALARTADAVWFGSDQISWCQRTLAEHANMRAALDFCLAEEDGHGALEMGGALRFFWFACGFAREGRHYLDRALALSPAASPARSRALWACGLAALAQGDADATGRMATAFRAAVAAESDESARIAVAYLEAVSFLLDGRVTEAAQVLDAQPRRGPADGAQYPVAWFLVWVSRPFAYVHLGRFAEALAVADELSAECARRGETWTRAYGDYMRALAALGLGRATEAAAHARTALDGKRRLHDSLGIATVVDVLACAALASGHAEQAARFLGFAEQVWHTLGTPQAGVPELIAARAACEISTRRLIGDDAYQAAFHAGYTTDRDTGIAEALAPPGS